MISSRRIDSDKSNQKHIGGPNPNKLSAGEKKRLNWGKRRDMLHGVKGILLEGFKLIEEAVAVMHPFEAVWFTETAKKENPYLIAQLEATSAMSRRISERLMRQISSMDTPPGVIAVAPQPDFIYRSPKDPFSLIVTIPLIQDPGNLGGVIRTADYFGVDEIWLGKNSVDPFSPKTLRGAMGASFRLAVRQVEDLPVKLRDFKSGGAKIWAAVAHGETADIRIDSKGSRILIVGSESHGIDPDVLNLCDHFVKIPGSGKGESLNLAVAAGILIYQATAGRFDSNLLKR